jgi:hypothetical protein
MSHQISHRNAVLDTKRRVFLKVGIAGSALLCAGRWLTPAPAAEVAAASTPLKNLTAEDAVVLKRIIPVMLYGALPLEEAALKTAIDEVAYGVDLTIGYQPPGVRQEIRDLFNLLNNAATRALVAGVWKPWDKATADDVREFLSGWRDSRFDLLRSAYIGLNNLIVGSWYGNPRSWSRIGYSGPPKVA